MNPYAFAALIVSMLVNLLTFSFFLGFYFGTFKEFKKNTEQDLRDLKSVFFTESQTPRVTRKARAQAHGEVEL